MIPNKNVITAHWSHAFQFKVEWNIDELDRLLLEYLIRFRAHRHLPTPELRLVMEIWKIKYYLLSYLSTVTYWLWTVLLCYLFGDRIPPKYLHRQFSFSLVLIFCGDEFKSWFSFKSMWPFHETEFTFCIIRIDFLQTLSVSLWNMSLKVCLNGSNNSQSEGPLFLNQFQVLF